MKKTLALLLALMMIMALAACGETEETPVEAAPAEEAAPAVDAAAPAVEGAASGEPAVEGAASGEPAEAAEAAAPAAEEDTFAAWKEYAAAYATAGAPTEEEKTSVANAILACSTYEEVTAISQMSVLLENVILSYDAWVEAGCPAADTSNMTAGDPNASGEASGEATAEPAA